MPKRAGGPHVEPRLRKDPKSGHLDESSQSRIGDQLRGLYREIVEEPVPDRFVKLLEQLEKSTAAKDGTRGDSQ